MKITFAHFHRDGKWQSRRLALIIAVKATTTLSGNNFNAVLGMWSGPGAFFTFSDPIISRTSSGEVGVMGVSFGSERIS
jgi:hypothetical protein